MSRTVDRTYVRINASCTLNSYHARAFRILMQDYRKLYEYSALFLVYGLGELYHIGQVWVDINQL